MTAKPRLSPSEAARLHRQTGHGSAVALIESAGDGDVLIDLGYGGLPLADAELIGRAILRDVLNQIERDFHDCPACRLRHARLSEALAVLERDSTGARSRDGVH